MGPNPDGDHDAVVTYTRILPQNEPVRSGRPAVAVGGRRETTLDAAELGPPDLGPAEPLLGDPLLDRPGAGALGGLRADRPENVADFIEDANRPDWMRYSLIGAALAVVAGVGILAATVGVATFNPASRDDGATSLAAVNGDEVDGAESASEPSSVAIREIPMTTETAPQSSPPVLAAPPKAVAPPIPRVRPDGVAAAPAAAPGTESPRAASVSPASSFPASPSSSAARPDIARIESTPSAKPTPKLVAPILPAPMPQTATAPKAVAEPRTGGGATDGLIVSIEEALAKIDATAPAAPNGVGSASALPPVLLPPPQAAAPHATATPQSYPPYSSDAGPYYDVLPPPPRSGNGYGDGSYSDGPVPPASVPQSYPQGANSQDIYLQDTYPQTSGIYQPDPYAYPPPTEAEEAEARRPGILRRTIAKAGEAVGRVFSRD